MREWEVFQCVNTCRNYLALKVPPVRLERRGVAWQSTVHSDLTSRRDSRQAMRALPSPE